MADIVQEEKPKPPKKRTRNPDGWKRVKQKRARIAGKEYLNVRGNYVAPRKIGPDCQCKLMCYKHVDESMRKMIFEGFYDLKSYDEQNAYLFGLIRKHDIKRKTKPLSARRTCTYKYYLRFRGREINVCKVAFARIHAISAKKIRGLCEKLDQNILFPKDGRGKHSNRPQKIQPETQELIKRHLYSLLRSPEVRDYFKEDKNHPASTELNITKLYKHFLQTYDPEALIPGSSQLNACYTPKVKMWLYRHIFHQEFKTKDYQLLKKKVEMGYRPNSDLADYTLQDKVFTKKTKRKANKPQKKLNNLQENCGEYSDSMSSTSTGVPTIIQKFPKMESAPAVIHLPMDVSFTSFTQDGRPTQIIDATNRNQVILDPTNRNQATMIQPVNRNQVMIAEAVNRSQVMIATDPNRTPTTLNLQKINYTIQDTHGNQHPAGAQNYQIFQAEAYHPNVLGQHTDHPIYHIDKGGGELISLRPIRLAGDVNMQLPTGQEGATPINMSLTCSLMTEHGRPGHYPPEPSERTAGERTFPNQAQFPESQCPLSASGQISSIMDSIENNPNGRRFL